MGIALRKLDFLSRYAKKFLNSRGYRVELERYSSSYLSRYGFDIETFVDIGVFEGTPVFYELFQKKRIIMIDPIPGIENRVDCRHLNATIIQAGADAKEGILQLNVSGAYSSFLARKDGRGAPEQVVEVRTAPLDTLLAEVEASGPYGLKIDTEGFELLVLRGATETLKETKFIFAEISLEPRFEGSYRPSEVVAFLSQHGFELAETIPNERHSRHFDALFVPNRFAAI